MFENFSAMATQAAVLAGFTTTCLIEIQIPQSLKLTHRAAVTFLHIAAIISISANITCVSLSTITSIWGSSKALRGKDGSMDEAVDGISKERNLIFNSFALGLGGNLCTVLAVCFIIMDGPTSYVACSVVLYTAFLIYYNSNRILSKFVLHDTIRLDDLTRNKLEGHGGGYANIQYSNIAVGDGDGDSDEETGNGGSGRISSPSGSDNGNGSYINNYTIPLPGRSDASSKGSASRRR